MENNIKVYRVHRALAWFYGVLLCLSLVLGAMGLEGSNSMGPLVGAIVFLGLFVTVHHLIAKGAKNKQRWAQGGSAVVAILMLFGIPIGTIIGIYLLVNNSWQSKRVESA